VYAFLTLLGATVQAGLVAAGRKVESLRTRRTVKKARPRTLIDLVDAGAAPRKTRPSGVYARAIAGPEGTLTAPFSGTECVWYVVRASERFWAYGPGPFGPKKVERSINAADHVSGPLTIVDDTGSVQVDPTGAQFDLGEPAFSDFDAREGGDGRLYAQMSELIGTPLRVRHRRMTIGFLIEEWIVTADDELHVVGNVRDDEGNVVLAKTGRRPFVVARQAASPSDSS
jgi:E3 Ubiquitin ligase